MRRAAILAGLALAACPPAAADDLREESLVRRVQWPVTFEPRVEGGCDGLTADDVVIREDGVQVPVGALERRRVPAVHAIVIDASGSMQISLDAAKAAALAYLERLPPDEPAMLATFSDSLVLDQTLTTDRAALAESLDAIEPQAYTALDTAMYFTVNHLATRPERKILVLLSDGCDTASMAGHSLRAVGKIAADVPNLTIFPIGIDLPARCSSSLLASRLDNPRLPLQKLARDSGGRMFETTQASGLGAIFDEIFERLESEGFASYRPLYHGEGPRDVPGETMFRRVRVESAQPKSCRIRSAGPLRRAEHPAATESPVAASEGKIVYRDWWSESGDAEDAVGRLWLREGAMVGHGADVEREPAWLYLAVPFYFEGKYRTAREYDVRYVTRDYVVEVPAFDELESIPADAETLLLDLLDSDDEPFVPVPGVESRRGRAHRWLGEKWIHGHTLLELRQVLAHGLFAYDGYREFAYRKAREAYREEMRGVLASSPEVGAMSPAERARLERAIDEHRPEPTDAQLARFLAAWLGDRRARDLVVGLETRAVNALLDAGSNPGRAAEWIAAIDTFWDELDEWFPPPTQVRVVAPLVPRYDAERDVIGFWRIVLPEVSGEEPPADAIPPRPLALALLRDRGLGGFRVEDLRYGWDEDDERRRLLRDARRGGLLRRGATWRNTPAISMSIVADGGERARMTVLWEPGDPPVPACLAIDGAGGAAVEALGRLAPACDGGRD